MQHFIIDKTISDEIKTNLKKYGNIIFTDTVNNLYEPVNTHPDIQIHFFDNYKAICCPELYNYYKKILPQTIFLIAGKKKAGGGYPNDASYNVAVFGRNLVCNINYTEKIILDYYENLGYNIINVKQGYTKCNICPVADNAVITEDDGIYRELISNNIDVCKINSGEINLKNFKYGFIGGATGFIDKNSIGVLGDIKKHLDFDKINTFVNRYNKQIISLGNSRVTDYGSIISFNL